MARPHYSYRGYRRNAWRDGITPLKNWEQFKLDGSNWRHEFNAGYILLRPYKSRSWPYKVGGRAKLQELRDAVFKRFRRTLTYLATH